MVSGRGDVLAYSCVSGYGGHFEHVSDNKFILHAQTYIKEKNNTNLKHKWN